MTCNEVMTPAPVTCRPGDAIVDAARLMRSYDVGSLPVVKDDESQMLIGVIPTWPHSRSWGYGPSGLLGVVLVVIVILLLLGKL